MVTERMTAEVKERFDDQLAGADRKRRVERVLTIPGGEVVGVQRKKAAGDA